MQMVRILYEDYIREIVWPLSFKSYTHFQFYTLSTCYKLSFLGALSSKTAIMLLFCEQNSASCDALMFIKFRSSPALPSLVFVPPVLKLS